MNNYLAYLHCIGFSHRNFFKIFKYEHNYKDFFDNFSYEDLNKLGIENERIEKIMERKNKLILKRIDDVLKDKGVTIISFFNEDYPENLKNIPNPPFLIYVRGKLRSDLRFLAIVGSRKGTKYSEAVLERLIPDLIKKDFGIVSGGAYGVDSLSHKIAVANNGYTICVNGTGIDSYYPYLNKNLFENIISSGGAIISIFPIGGEVGQYNFPIRNEIIAGISDGTLITEAGESSGTLITARLALELNKDVFVIPGDITRITSIGSNNLIKNGLGKFTICIDDILEEYEIQTKLNSYQQIFPQFKREIIFDFDNETEKKIYDSLINEPNSSSILSEKLDLDIDIVNMKLSILEIRGLVKLDFGGIYRVSG